MIAKTGCAAAVSALLCGFVFSGCAREEKLHRVSGKVTFAGQPIPKGVIHFMPQAPGPAGYANIWDGQYDTAGEGKGIRGGTYEIRVNGFDGIAGPDAPFGQALFPEYMGTAELPAKDSTYDLDIPKGR